VQAAEALLLRTEGTATEVVDFYDYAVVVLDFGERWLADAF
jgi:hypothetical protein